jgi:hypothetical protein
MSLVPSNEIALSPSTQAQLQTMLSCLDNVVFLVSARYSTIWYSSTNCSSHLVEKEADYPIIVFDGFHELVDTLENPPDKEKALFVDTLLEWLVRNSHKAHFVLVGENYFGQEIISESNYLLLNLF